MMTEIKEYTGQLVGGPDEGNFVTATVDRFPIKAEYTLWLDGPDNTPSSFIVEGTYIWQPQRVVPVFKWELKGVGYPRPTIK
jgi:hypothetical protein